MSTSAVPVASGLPPSLESARSIVWPLLEERVRALQPDLAQVCLYHLGLTDGGGGTSKLVRAGLMMAAAAGLDLPPREVGTEATAVELLHNSTLLHDDIIDDDRTRRGQPSAWSAFGVPLAVLAGDAMQAAGLRMALDSGDRQARLAADAISLVLAGQTDELMLSEDPAASVAQFEQVATRKTSALLECCLTAPALRADATDAALAALRSAGHHLGIAWQAANDLEDIWGDPAVTGKPARGDLKRRNLTLPVLTTLAADGPAGTRLRQLWRSADTTATHLDEMAGLIEQIGGRQAAQDLSRHHLDQALNYVSHAGLTAAGTDELRTLFHLIVHRTT
ncbi:polyprenyl synthetase family protein [Amycolatopsis sp. FDAARGOS 1241]|uniref:polyprenyl synthetase family protein n=1 Tax=Amycolatopsis sp. FDAARGOS 1241 TaxID=2778070 RepID=UPI0019512978|nr:polyprenyl synthetase family protein [Amycolatopsis sp. FDAARGOS 1241]QRP42974.1 polyprenyl synthetase family protein [Amycolatopsis sp. FDAARGOS 1241]